MDVYLFQCLVWVIMVLIPTHCQRDYDQEDFSSHTQTHNRREPIRRLSNTEFHPHERHFTEDRSVSERSIPFDVNVQRVQNDGKRTNDDEVGRTINSNAKIVHNVHNVAKTPSISTRRGVAGIRPEPITSGKVVFPGMTSAFEPHITNQECLQTGICEEVPNYPQEKVDELVNKLKSSKYPFNVDRLVTPEIAQRIGANEEMLELCRSKETVIAPKAVRDSNSKWYNVLNGKDQVLQGFRVEICTPESAPCSDLIYVVSNAYNKTCVQKYQYRQMVVLNEEGNHVEKEFKIPSCCACAVYAVSQFGNR